MTCQSRAPPTVLKLLLLDNFLFIVSQENATLLALFQDFNVGAVKGCCESCLGHQSRNVRGACKTSWPTVREPFTFRNFSSAIKKPARAFECCKSGSSALNPCSGARILENYPFVFMRCQKQVHFQQSNFDNPLRLEGD